MKDLKQFAEINNLDLIPVTYRHQFGKVKRKGYDLCSGPFILLSFEPVDYSSGEKWFIRNKFEGYNGPDYLKRITANFLNTWVNINAKSYRINSVNAAKYPEFIKNCI